jgi:raffinose/stachyose/melibiose transport system permease protein
MKKFSGFLNRLATVLLAAVAMVPFYFLIVMALSTPKWFNVLVPEFHFANFADAWTKSHLGSAMLNSVIITVFTVILVILLASSAGYAFARFKNKFHKITYNAFLFSMLIPAIINTVPVYILMRQIGGINTYWAMVLLLATGSLPFAIFLYTSFIEGLGREMEESAYIDGCTKFMAFWRIIFPLLKPVTSAVVILNAVSIWNNYGTSVFFLQKQAMRTVPLAISSFVQTYGANWNLMAAAALIGLLPAVGVFLAFQKYFIKGITTGAVKG